MAAGDDEDGVVEPKKPGGAGHLGGNAEAEYLADRGWFVGHFIGAAGLLRSTPMVEVKWGRHAKGEVRRRWGYQREATTLSVLVRGRFRLSFADAEVLLAKAGDYVIWAPGVAHRWTAEAESVILSVRWPSRPDDAVETDDPRPLRSLTSTTSEP